MEVRSSDGGQEIVQLSDGSSREVDLTVPPPPIEPSGWSLHVEEVNPDGPVDIHVDLDELRDWREIDAVAGSSGVGTYRTVLIVPEEMASQDLGAYLEVEGIDSAAQVFLNGERVSPAVGIHGRLDLADRLQPGENVLEVVVATSLRNRITALAQDGRQYGGVAAALPATQPYGLTAPVRVIPYSRAVVIPPAPDVERLGGADRAETAAAISRAHFAAGVPVALVATGDGFADALAAGPVAASLGGPVLLTGRDALPAATAAELRRLGTTRVVVAGGPAAVSDSVVRQLEAIVGTVDRVAGADRFGTAAQLSSATFQPGVDVVYVASGEVFADALSAGAAAARDDRPLLIVSSSHVPADIRDELVRLAPDRIVVVGGPAVVSEGVEAALSAIAPVERWAGPDRYATALQVSVGGRGSVGGHVLLATGEDFPDALAGAAAAASVDGPLLLTGKDVLPAVTAEELRRLAPTRLRVLGGPAAVSDAVLADLLHPPPPPRSTR